MAGYCGTEGTVIKLHLKAGMGHQPTVQVMHLDGRCWYWNGLCLRAPPAGSPQVRLWLPMIEMKELDEIIASVVLQAGAGRRHERELQAITRRGVPFEVELEKNIKPVGSQASAVAVGDELEVHVLCRPHRLSLHPKAQEAIKAQQEAEAELKAQQEAEAKLKAREAEAATVAFHQRRRGILTHQGWRPRPSTSRTMSATRSRGRRA